MGQGNINFDNYAVSDQQCAVPRPTMALRGNCDISCVWAAAAHTCDEELCMDENANTLYCATDAGVYQCKFYGFNAAGPLIQAA